MNDLIVSLSSKSTIKKALFDLLVVIAIYFVPAIAHIFSYPVYIFDPMRIVIVMSIIYTNRHNAFLLAATLPIFSFLVSAHPYFYKALIITSELSINVFLFFFLKDKFKNLFAALFASIVIAKIFYYAVKSTLVAFALIGTDVVSTPLYVQLIVAVILSVYIQFFISNKLKYKIINDK